MIGINNRGARPYEDEKLRKLILSRVFKGEKGVDIHFTTAHNRLQVYARRYEKDFLLFEGYIPREYGESRQIGSGVTFEEEILREVKEKADRVLNFYGDDQPRGGGAKSGGRVGVRKGTDQ